jgi:magnesium-transporting ATPase (P-type)
VSEGSGRLLVVAVGPQSEWGKTMALVGEAGDEDTPLQEKLGDMASSIGKVTGPGVGEAQVSQRDCAHLRLGGTSWEQFLSAEGAAVSHVWLTSSEAGWSFQRLASAE